MHTGRAMSPVQLSVEMVAPSRNVQVDGSAIDSTRARSLALPFHPTSLSRQFYSNREYQAEMLKTQATAMNFANE